jgi:hypothetical protein
VLTTEHEVAARMVGRMRYVIGTGHTEMVSKVNMENWQDNCRAGGLPSCGPGVPVYRVDSGGNQIQVKSQPNEVYDGQVDSSFSVGGFLGSVKAPDRQGRSDPRGHELRAKIESIRPGIEKAWQSALEKQLTWMEKYAVHAEEVAQSTMKKMFGDDYEPQGDSANPEPGQEGNVDSVGSSSQKRSAPQGGESSKRPRL